jgi:hypothetical protein
LQTIRLDQLWFFWIACGWPAYCVSFVHEQFDPPWCHGLRNTPAVATAESCDGDEQGLRSTEEASVRRLGCPRIARTRTDRHTTRETSTNETLDARNRGSDATRSSHRFGMAWPRLELYLLASTSLEQRATFQRTSRSSFSGAQPMEHQIAVLGAYGPTDPGRIDQLIGSVC